MGCINWWSQQRVACQKRLNWHIQISVGNHVSFNRKSTRRGKSLGNGFKPKNTFLIACPDGGTGSVGGLFHRSTLESRQYMFSWVSWWMLSQCKHQFLPDLSLQGCISALGQGVHSRTRLKMLAAQAGREWESVKGDGGHGRGQKCLRIGPEDLKVSVLSTNSPISDLVYNFTESN